MWPELQVSYVLYYLFNCVFIFIYFTTVRARQGILWEEKKYRWMNRHKCEYVRKYKRSEQKEPELDRQTGRPNVAGKNKYRGTKTSISRMTVSEERVLQH